MNTRNPLNGKKHKSGKQGSRSSLAFFENLEPRLLRSVGSPNAPFLPESIPNYEATVHVNQNGDARATGYMSDDSDIDAYRVFFDKADETARFEAQEGTVDLGMAYYDSDGPADRTSTGNPLLPWQGPAIVTDVPAQVPLWVALQSKAANQEFRGGKYGLTIDGPSSDVTPIAIDTDTNLGTEAGDISGEWDYDFHSFTTTAAGEWTVKVTPQPDWVLVDIPSRGGMPVQRLRRVDWDVTVNIYDADGQPVYGTFTAPVNAEGSGQAETWTAQLEAGQTYHVRVDGLGAQEGDYTVSVECPPVAQAGPYTEPFTGGRPSTPGGWEYYSGNDGRIQRIVGPPRRIGIGIPTEIPSGYWLRMDDSLNDGQASLNEAILHMDLRGYQYRAELSFDHREAGDETDLMPTGLSTGHQHGDGLAISGDGETWFTIYQLGNTNADNDLSWNHHEIDLGAMIVEAEAAGMDFGDFSDVRIKFQQTDNWGWDNANPVGSSSDGREFDTIAVTAAEHPVRWETAGVADFNGDGHNDLLARNQDTGATGAWLMENGQYQSWLAMGTVPVAQWEIGGTGDFNRDGHADILWRNKGTGQLGTWLMDNGQFQSWVVVGTVPCAQWEIGGVADFNGDGHADILWRNKDTGVTGTWLMNDGQFQSWQPMGTAPADQWEIGGIGDFNDDGHADILWRNNDTGVTGTWLMEDGQFQSWVVLGTVPVQQWSIDGVGDLDGDGHDEILSHQPNWGALGAWPVEDDELGNWQGVGVDLTADYL